MTYSDGKSFEAKLEKADMHKAHERAEKVLERERIDPQKFKHYDKEMIARDSDYVKRMEAKFKMESDPESRYAKEVATVFEAIIHEWIELGNWLGSEASTILPSRYDDIVSKVDTIVRYQREGEDDTHLGLAIDVTFSPSIENKIEDIKNNIQNGRLTEIKYFTSPDSEDSDEYAHKRLKVARVIIGVEMKVVEDLAYLWLEKDKKTLQKHPVQHVIGREIVDELKLFEEYARSQNKNEIASVYKEARLVVERNLQENDGSIWKKERDYATETNAMESLKDDRVLNSIDQYLNHIRALEIH